jgi:hypothetical protein
MLLQFIRPDDEVHSDNPPYLGVRQLWWPTVSTFEAGVRNDPDAFNQLVAKVGSAVTLLAQAERFLH